LQRACPAVRIAPRVAAFKALDFNLPTTVLARNDEATE
jgi:hypothetical protein